MYRFATLHYAYGLRPTTYALLTMPMQSHASHTIWLWLYLALTQIYRAPLKLLPSIALPQPSAVAATASLAIFTRIGCTKLSSSLTPSYPLASIVKRLSMAFWHFLFVILPSSDKPLLKADTKPISRNRPAALMMLAWASWMLVWSSWIFGIWSSPSRWKVWMEARKSAAAAVS